MKYRTKLFLNLSFLSILSTLLALIIVFINSRSLVLDTIRQCTLSIAKTGAASINGYELQKIMDGSAPTLMSQLKSYLAQIRDANRTTAFYIQNVYIVAPSKKDPSKFIFIVDSEEHPEEVYNYGAEFYAPELAHYLKEPFVPEFETAGKFGVWMTGYAPIFNDKNEYLGTLGIDINSSEFHQEVHKLLVRGYFALGISLISAGLIAFFLSKRVTIPLRRITEEVNKIEKGELAYELELQTQDEFGSVSKAIKSMVEGLKERERIKTGFARYVSQYVLDQVMQMDTKGLIKGERKKVTVLFADIRNFTSISEKLPPEQVVSILNEYFEKMLEVIFHFYGTLDKFIGDGMMVEFGAPIPDDQQETHAVKAALHMQQELEKLNLKWTKEGKPNFTIGIGLHTGSAVIGNIGSEKRMEFTAIGDTVNLASRLEQVTKQFGKPIIVSQTTYETIKDVFNWESLGPIQIKGRQEPINGYVPTFKKEEILNKL